MDIEILKSIHNQYGDILEGIDLRNPEKSVNVVYDFIKKYLGTENKNPNKDNDFLEFFEFVRDTLKFDLSSCLDGNLVKITRSLSAIPLFMNEHAETVINFFRTMGFNVFDEYAYGKVLKTAEWSGANIKSVVISTDVISNSAFQRCPDLQHIEISDCTTIKDHALSYCYNLVSAVIDASNLLTLGKNIFYDSNKVKITINGMDKEEFIEEFVDDEEKDWYRMHIA